MRTILVTGGGGFLGSNLVAALSHVPGIEVVVCDSFGRLEKWRNLVKHPVAEIIHPDTLFDWLAANRQHLEMIYHFGSVSNTTEKDVDRVLKSNFALSLQLFRWCNDNGVRLLYASSYATYGAGNQGFNDDASLEALKALRPMSPFGWSKQMFDLRVAAMAARGECRLPQWVGLKFFNMYGPNEYHKDDQKSVIAKMAMLAVRGGSVKLFRSRHPNYADGDQKRDVIYVKDCVKVALWFLANPNVSGLYNLGSGQASTFNAMARAIYAALGKPPAIHYIDMPEDIAPNYQYFTEANMQKLRAAGYNEPFMPLEDGIRDYVQNYLVKDDPYL